MPSRPSTSSALGLLQRFPHRTMPVMSFWSRSRIGAADATGATGTPSATRATGARATGATRATGVAAALSVSVHRARGAARARRPLPPPAAHGRPRPAERRDRLGAGVHTDADIATAERLLRAFDLAIREQANLASLPTDDVWETVASVFHSGFVETLQSGRADRLASYLSEAYRREVTHGLGPGRQVFEATQTPHGNRAIATLCVDRLAALAEAVGALPIENPEQGRWGVAIYMDPAEILGAIERELAADLTPPQTMGYFGVPAGRGLFFVRSADAIYTAWRGRALGARRFVEIGAGLAGVGHFARQLGAEAYAVYDLPVMNVIQGHSLISAGHDTSLLGEPDGPVSVRPWWHFERSPACDVVINTDSFPEIDPAFVASYLTTMRGVTRWFLSINQEGAAPGSAAGRLQNVVADLVKADGGFTRVSRAPYWLRRGYVEEIFEVR